MAGNKLKPRGVRSMLTTLPTVPRQQLPPYNLLASNEGPQCFLYFLLLEKCSSTTVRAAFGGREFLGRTSVFPLVFRTRFSEIVTNHLSAMVIEYSNIP